LYWDFFDRNRDKLAHNQRLGMVYQQLRRMDDGALAALRERASDLRARVAEL
jgi:deoxyribodipyrimidine photolyase-related protein